MGIIFLSYSNRDLKFIAKLTKSIEVAGFEVWIDREGIRGGDQWRSSIVKAIERADAFLIVLSSNSVISKNVRKELDLAESAKTRILPIEIGPVAIPPEMKYQLVGLQRIDFAESYDVGLNRLLSALRGEQVTSEKSVSTRQDVLSVVSHSKRRWAASIAVFVIGCVINWFVVVGIFDDILHLHDFTLYLLILGLIVTIYVTFRVWRAR